jgi:CBS-domain-containing membrane protein
MTSDVLTVRPETPLRELARILVNARIHRVMVVDKLRKPTGIVTSMDILAAVAREDASPNGKRPGAANSCRRRPACASSGRN